MYVDVVFQLADKKMFYVEFLIYENVCKISSVSATKKHIWETIENSLKLIFKEALLLILFTIINETSRVFYFV